MTYALNRKVAQYHYISNLFTKYCIFLKWIRLPSYWCVLFSVCCQCPKAICHMHDCCYLKKNILISSSAAPQICLGCISSTQEYGQFGVFLSQWRRCSQIGQQCMSQTVLKLIRMSHPYVYDCPVTKMYYWIIRDSIRYQKLPIWLHVIAWLL